MAFRLFEHTADIGIHIESENLELLFADAARALFTIIVENLDEVVATRTIEIELNGDQPDFLLVDWLSELLMKFELKKLVLSQFLVKYDGLNFIGKATGESIDFSRHRLVHEIKAITYHGLSVSHVEHGWSADVIVDI